MPSKPKQRGNNLVTVMKIYFIAVILILVAAALIVAYKEPDYRLALILSSIGAIVWMGIILSIDMMKDYYIFITSSVLVIFYLTGTAILHHAINESPTNYLLYSISAAIYVIVVFMSILVVIERPKRR
jgi:hypothetical protein